MATSRITRRQPWRRFVVFAAGLLVAGTQLAVPVAAVPRPAVSPSSSAVDALIDPTSTIQLAVQAARTEPRANGGDGVTEGDPVTAYKWIINVDNTGTTTQRNADPGSGCSPLDPSYPDSCDWASIAGLASSAPVFAQGDETTFPSGGLTLPAGRYLVSVLADGYKLDGTPFTIPMESPGTVVVPLQPWPLPTSTIKAQVFMDVTEANGQYDPGEDGLPNFRGLITDYLGQVNTDVFGNPLCTVYDYTDANDNGVQDPGEINLSAPDYEPTVVHMGGKCLSGDINMDGVLNGTDESLYITLGLDPTLARGELTIPNLGTNRYALSVIAPTGTSWVQTTTLEGNHDWDWWAMEGSTGYDTEFVVGAEPFPAAIFGFLPAPSNTTYWDQAAHKFQDGGGGTIKGLVDAMDVYIPQKGGLNLPTVEIQGAKIDHAIEKPWISLSDLNRGDTAVYLGRGNADGTFQIDNVPDGTYTLTYWDDPQDYILDMMTVVVSGGEVVDTGVLPIFGWWAKFDGTVFNDLNRNGKRDAGEPGVPNFGLTLRGRDNNLMDRGARAVSTDSKGHYSFDQAYPLTEWVVLEAYDDRYYTTGVTYQADNQPNETTVLGAGVDVSVLPIIGLDGRLDWGVHFYDAAGTNGVDPQNGGIVGSISYDTTRNELDPQYAAAEDWQPGVSGVTVELHSPVDCGTNPSTPCDANGDYELAPDGSYAQGKLLNTYVSETWERPTDCVARDVDGKKLDYPADQQVLPIGSNKGCLEGPLMGIQFGPYPTDQGTPDANFGAAVDGNYGFGDGCFGDGVLDASDPSAPECVGGEFTGLDAGDYLVHIDLADMVDERGDPIYKVTREEDINIGNGDQVVPAVPPPACAGALHTVDVAGIDADGDLEYLADGVTPNPAFDGDGPNATVNPTFIDIGASPYEGQPRPLCDTKLVQLQNGKSVVPMFNVFTDVPLPGRYFGLTVDDLMATTDPKNLLYGEKAPLQFNPVGIYDAWNRLITTAETDYNGIYDVLLPSTNRINCPTPSGVCAGVYRFVGNDPGTPGHLNLNYNPAYRTIAAEFEAFPGLIMPADTAPVPVGALLELPGTTQLALASCPVNAPDVTAANRVPELYGVSRPYVTGTLPSFTIFGKGFGSPRGTGQVTLDGNPNGITISLWTDTEIRVSSLSSSVGFGPHQLMVTASNGKTIVNGLTVYKIGGSYNPIVYEVGPSDNPNRLLTKPAGWQWFTPAETLPAAANHAIQAALDAIPASNSSLTSIVVVYPNKTTANPRQNPRGAYYENLIVTKRVKLQGVGPGAPDGSVRGSIIDGGAFGGDSPVATDWYTRMNTATWAGNQDVFDGAVISLFLPSGGGNAFPTSLNATTAPTIDGFDLRGGDQLGFPGNLGDLLGVPGEAGVGVTQGGAIFANAYARNLQITNNVVQNNGGTYGTIRIGTPDLADPDNQNDAVRIMNNRIVANGGTNLAGGVGIFAGADGYAVRANDICGNFSSEYGGGLSVYGRSPGGSIDHNRIYYNQSYDEGGGVMIAGQLPTDPSFLSPGSGAVSIHDNLIQSNVANDDGGGIRFLMAGNFPMSVYNNMVVDNVSSHEGGGIALDDAPNVRIYNNTIMKNVTTATAATSDGQPAPAGLSTGRNSVQLQGTLPSGSPVFSNPLLFNDIFWDNRAGTRVAGSVHGIGAAGDASPIDHWDLGTADGSGLLAPTNSIVQQSTVAPPSPTHPYTTSATNLAADPSVLNAYDVSLVFAPWRTNPNFVGALIVGLDLPPKLLGDYHISGTGSPAFNLGAASKTVPSYQGGGTLNAPSPDIDGQPRPSGVRYDSGADQIPPPLANLAITKTDGVATVQPGASLTYTIVVTNGGPASVTDWPITDTFPAGLTVTNWSCAPSPSCAATGSGNARTGRVTLAGGDSATFTAQATLSASATPGNLANTASVASTAGDTVDPNTSNNSATDTDSIVLPLPALTQLDNFDRANATTLLIAGDLTPDWVQAANIGVNANQARSTNSTNTPPPLALWAGAGTPFGAKQGAAFTFVQGGSPISPSAPLNGTALILKANDTDATPTRYLRVQYETGGGGRVVVTRTVDGTNFTNATTFSTGTWVIGDTLTAVANADGSVDVWRNATYLGRSSAASGFIGTGRIGMRLPNNSRVDNFSGQNVP